MPQASLDDRINALQGQLNPETLQAPVSTDNSTGQGPLRRIYITRGRLAEQQPGDVSGTGPSSMPTPIGSEASGGGAIEATAPTQGFGDTNAQNGNALLQPTPADNTAERIDMRRQQALEALKSEGFDGYTADVKDMKTEEEQSSVVKAVTDIAAGFNVSLARTLSLPRETVDRGMALLGLDYMQHGGPQQQTIDALNRMGIPAYEVDNLANKVGRGALPALATWGATVLAAPSLAANTGVGVVGHLGRQIGEWTLKHPIAALWLGQTSQTGGKVATHTLGDNAAVEFGGELAGGVAPGAVAGIAKRIPIVAPAVRGVGKLAGMGVNAIADTLPTDLGNAIKKYNPLYQPRPVASGTDPLIDTYSDANKIQTFAKDQIYSAQRYQDKAIENAINSIPTSGTPAQVQTRTHKLLEDAETISKRIVSGFWEKVPLKTRINVSDINADVHAMRKELVDSDNVRPDTMMDKIIATVSPKRDLDTGRMLPAPKPTIQKLRDLQSQIGTAITEERARDAPREGQVRNMARLSEIIDDNIAKQLPNNTSIEQARQMSRRHNDLFSRGPINDILSKRRTGDFRVPVADSVDTLLQKTDGLAALKAVQEGVSNYPRIPTTRFLPAAQRGNAFAVTPDEKNTLDQLVKSAEDSIRASFREAAEAGPQKAVAYSQKNEDAIKALSGVAGELNFAAQKIAAALAESKAMKTSALAKFAETSPDAAVKNIFAQRDPAAVARQLMVSFKGDPEALGALRNQVLNELIYDKAKTNPNVIARMMREPKIENLLEAVLSGDQRGRLKKMVDTAVQIGVEDETGLKAAFKAPFRTAGRIGGAMIGRRLAPGTLQGPSIFSKSLGTYMEQTLGYNDPADLLSQAVLDPHWERLLYSRIPTTTREMEAAKKSYRRIFAGIETTEGMVMRRLSKDENDE